jgi:FAD/FMN-containing dehydrogenase
MSYTSWGRYPYQSQKAATPRFLDELPDVLATLPRASLPYGNGRSYGDVCLAQGGSLIAMGGLDRLISFLLRDLISHVLPYGWFPSVTPGTQLVTVGGALANDVHGKNHHSAGSFGDHVIAFELLRSNGERIHCTADENADWFTATIGGLGLTGVISWVELQLRRVGGPWMQTESIKFAHLRDYFTLAESSQDWEYTVAWIDCLAKGHSLGRGHFLRANHLKAPLDRAIPARKHLNFPVTPPLPLVNQLSLRLFNTLYFHRQLGKTTQAISHYLPYFYPLDSISHWNRMYGPRGFQQYQCVLPSANAQEAIAALLSRIASGGQGSFLAVLKTFGDRRGRGMLSFARPGVTLALDFAEQGARTALLFSALDQIVQEAGGALYPAKDAHMPPSLFRAAYPEWPTLEARRDPALCSAFWHRVTQEN